MASSPLHIGICDDEPYWQTLIKELCSTECKSLKIAAKYYVFGSGKELLKSQEWLDILFLDEEMPDISGCAIKEYYENQNRNTMIVFVTSHPEILYDSFGKNVYGFLHKPLDKPKFSRILTKLVEKLSAHSYLQFFDSISGTVKIAYRNILYIKAEGSYSRICLNGKESILIRRGLGEIESSIEDTSMVRVHKSYIVNLNHCCRLHSNSATLTINDGTIIPIARRRKNQVQELYATLSMERAERIWNL